MSSYISNDELLDRIQKLEKEIEKLKERNNAETKEIIINTAREEVKYQSSIIKNEVRDELRKELSTKEDLMLIEERLSGKIKSMEEGLKRYTDNKFNQIIILQIIILFAIIITNPNAINLIKLIFGFK